MVVIPTYNEKGNIALLIPAIFTHPILCHIFIVDDASPDKTQNVVNTLQKAYPGRLHLLTRPSNLGLGAAYIAGFQFALANNYQNILTMDADFSHDPADLTRLSRTCQQAAYSNGVI